MGTITVGQEGAVGAPAELTYRLIADDEHHRHILPEGFSDFEVLEGGVGAGTLHRFKVAAGGKGNGTGGGKGKGTGKGSGKNGRSHRAVTRSGADEDARDARRRHEPKRARRRSLPPFGVDSR